MDTGHEADNLILEKIIMLGSPMSDYGEYFNVELCLKNMGGYRMVFILSHHFVIHKESLVAT